MVRLRNWAPLLPVAAALAGCIPSTTTRGPGPSEPAPPRRGSEVRTLPAAPPAWEAQPVNADARSVPATTYIVRRGDTLRGISNRTGAGSEAIARANGLRPPFTIFPNQRLTIPGGRYHTVHEGETGIAIARAYGVDWGRIVALNDLDEPYILRTGMRLLIPGTGSGSGDETLEERAARFHVDIDDIVTGGEPALAHDERPAQPTASSARVLPSGAAVAEPEHMRGGFQWPAHGEIIGRFGPGQSGERNDGIKIGVPLDTPVLASADGVVAYVGGDIPQLGGVVILKHGDGWTTVYGHIGQILVQRGQAVERGQTIGLSGDSGFITRPQLHFEMRKGRDPIDPLARLPRN
ncbi:M23 family metallopeptidase [Stakelama tenebrarum]|uniref:M23 family metallopeptidase n=1 Tax=Stakelama tenebrarum TaxID=2711215 RepID=A0A6G6Y750_9SPHN|nr:M23 family metallopeptidase [Sphingosinithalassobacter tenebrarum]QIG80406.1 M23 family metallopeptidase [Sphingosinithalassobacter tenebrarum]